MKRFLAVIVCGLLIAVASPAQAETHDWPQWQGPQRDRVSNETGLMKSWPSGGPRRLWLSKECGLGYSGPAIVAGRLYIMGSRGDTDYLLAFDADTGEELWAARIDGRFEQEYGDGPRGTPAVDGDRVYGLGAQGTLVCVDAASGKEHWRKTMQELGGRVPNWGYSESVLVDEDLVLCTPGGSQGAIAALDKMNGDVRWQTGELDDRPHYSSIIRATFHGKPHYVQLLKERLVGLAPADGKVLWESPWPGDVAVIPTPLAHGNFVYATAGYNAGCRLVEIGPNNDVRELYHNMVMKNKHDGFVLVGDHIYGYSDGAGWVCQDFKTGRQVWRERNALKKGSIVAADGMLYCLEESSGDVALVAASPEGWEERGRFTLDPQSDQGSPRGRIWTHPVLANGKLYLRHQELLFCFDVRG